MEDGAEANSAERHALPQRRNDLESEAHTMFTMFRQEGQRLTEVWNRVVNEERRNQ